MSVEFTKSANPPNDKSSATAEQNAPVANQSDSRRWLERLVRPLCVTLQNGDIIERPSGHRQIYLNGKITNDAPKLSFRASLARWIFRHCVRPFLAENNESRLILYTGNHPLTPQIRQYEELSSIPLDAPTLRCL